MSTRSSFIDPTPIVSSIADRSSGEWTRKGKLLRGGLGQLLVRRLIQKVVRRIAGELELQDPAFTVGIRVDQLRLGGKLFVDLGDPSGHRRVEVAGRLDRLDDAKSLSRPELAPGARQLEEHDIAELRLGVIRDPDRGVLPVDRDPFMRPRVPTASHATLLLLAECACSRPRRRDRRARRAPIERKLDDLGRGLPAPDLNHNLVSDPKCTRFYHRERDRVTEEEGMCSAGDDANRAAAEYHSRSVASDVAW